MGGKEAFWIGTASATERGVKAGLKGRGIDDDETHDALLHNIHHFLRSLDVQPYILDNSKPLQAPTAEPTRGTRRIRSRTQDVDILGSFITSREPGPFRIHDRITQPALPKVQPIFVILPTITTLIPSNKRFLFGPPSHSPTAPPCIL